MGPTYTPPTPFAAWLKGELDARGWGVRTLAKRIAPANSELPRRNLNRYLHEGKLPTDASRTDIARGLGIAETDIPATEKAESDADDEEADPAMRDAFALFVDLLGRIPREAAMENAEPTASLPKATVGSDKNGG